MPETPIRHVRIGALYVVAQEVAATYSSPSRTVTVTNLLTIGLERLLAEPDLAGILAESIPARSPQPPA